MSSHAETKAFNSFSAMGKAADNHFIDAEREVKYWGQHRIYVGVVGPVEIQGKEFHLTGPFQGPQLILMGLAKICL